MVSLSSFALIFSLPHLQVSGDSNEHQFLASLKMYRDREDFMVYALHKLFAFAEDGHLRILQTEILLVRRMTPPQPLSHTMTSPKKITTSFFFK